jgi:hypothetical protein
MKTGLGGSLDVRDGKNKGWRCARQRVGTSVIARRGLGGT